jgi:hypothetical protein
MAKVKAVAKPSAAPAAAAAAADRRTKKAAKTKRGKPSQKVSDEIAIY